MSEPKLISPMLDNFAMGDPISDHNGVRCCPAMERDSENKYIVKIISTPASQSQLDALLLSGAYADKEAALSYFHMLAEGITQEAQILQNLASLEGFVPYESWQIVPMEDGVGYDVYLLGSYKKTLQRRFRKESMTHLGALNLGLDLCAALAVCRRSGYLYVDLKPENIYITDEQGYRIGDLGFLKLDSLKYASLPERYRSAYTAPEITDAFSSLNTTVDIYAVGLILYQAFNDGMLPFHGEVAVDEEFPAPAYADYEMAEIILKACSPNPAMRWQDPIEMGQALVSYIQRNGTHDTPIVPSSTIEVNEASIETDDPDSPEVPEINDTDSTSTPDTDAEEAPVVENSCSVDSTSDYEISEESIYSEDNDGNLTFLMDDANDETAPDPEAADIDYEEVTEEVSDMLVQADELIAHQTPEPVIQPEPVDVPIPPMPTTAEETPAEEESMVDESEDIEYTDEADGEPADETVDEDPPEDPAPAKRGKTGHWIRNLLIALVVLALLAGGFYYYRNYYLQPIESILLEDGDDGLLTVLVTSKIDEDKLTVVCSDTYGNQLTSPVKDSKAVFTGLAPNSAFNVEVIINGFHRLTGDTSAAYTTPVQTNIVQFSAVTGSEDGSVILGFTIDGPDASQWKIRYNTPDEEDKEVSFSGHMVTLSGLTIGNEYTFTLVPENDLLITGITEITHTASKIIKAENLSITGYLNNVLTATWSAPEDITIQSWTVRCYNNSGFDKTIVVKDTKAVFEDIVHGTDYTIEVTAAGMSVSERAYAAANSITVTEFTADDSDPNKIDLQWNSNGTEPAGGWLLLYTMDGSAVHEIACESGNSATLNCEVPGVRYVFTLETADGVSVLGGRLVYDAPGAEAFSGYGVSAEHMDFKMCKTPSFRGWDRHDLKKSDYTTKFSIGEDASFLVRLKHEYSTSKDTVVTLYVIRNEDGNIVSTSTRSASWTSMWYRNYCELDIPSMPQAAGRYNISVYFNGALVNVQDFTVIAE